ncbi:MAG: hypothetical protein ACE5G8_11560 [Anaerolineae bacterium]
MSGKNKTPPPQKVSANAPASPATPPESGDDIVAQVRRQLQNGEIDTTPATEIIPTALKVEGRRLMQSNRVVPAMIAVLAFILAGELFLLVQSRGLAWLNPLDDRSAVAQLITGNPAEPWPADPPLETFDPPPETILPAPDNASFLPDPPPPTPIPPPE